MIARPPIWRHEGRRHEGERRQRYEGSGALERALFATLACHGAAMVGMAALLLPMMPGGGVEGDAARIHRIAAHPWLFRLGWLPWQLTALSDLALAAALWRTRWVPRGPALAVVVLTVLAVIPDQGGQALWITRGVDLAREAVQSGDDRAYLAFEGPTFLLTAAWGALLYTLGAVAWSVCFARGGAWTRGLTALSVVLWPAFLVVAIGPLLPPAARLPPGAVAAGNAIGFVLLEVWFALVLEQVLRRARPTTPHGRDAQWAYPHEGALRAVFDAVANSRFARGLCERLPVLAFLSDITDVIYVNYLVPADALAGLVPEGLELQRLGPSRDHAVFTFLTYRHGHFGPAIAGPLRRLFSSPIQSNWRVYVRDPRTGKEGIYFVTNAVTTRLHALGARLMAEGMPMHLLAGAAITRDTAGAVRMTLDAGHGSAPDAVATLTPGEPRLPPPWSVCFADYRAMLAYTVPQDRAMSTQPWRRSTTSAEIDLGIPLEACEPLEGEVRSRAARAIAGDAAPLSFRVARVAFRFGREVRDRWLDR